MKRDPLGRMTVTTIDTPPFRGPGSGKEAWRRYAWELGRANDDAWRIIEEQREAIRDLEAEVELLKRQIAARKPKGGRPAVPPETVDRIEAAIAAGGTDRHLARMFHVSHVTVNRIRRRMAERERVAAKAAAA